MDEPKKILSELKKALALAKNAGKEKKEKAAPAASQAGGSSTPAVKERLLLKTAKVRDMRAIFQHMKRLMYLFIRVLGTTVPQGCSDARTSKKSSKSASRRTAARVLIPRFRAEGCPHKYGEDSKLIFDLMDQGGGKLTLRYDHNVPLARYLAMIGGTAPQSNLWQIGRVYDRDNPVMSKGRMREFMQAYFDITGTWDPMIADAKLFSLLCTILLKLDVGEFTIKVRCYCPP